MAGCRSGVFPMPRRGVDRRFPSHGAAASGRQEFLGTSGALKKMAALDGLAESRCVVPHNSAAGSQHMAFQARLKWPAASCREAASVS
jgi:hypothetical protein